MKLRICVSQLGVLPELMVGWPARAVTEPEVTRPGSVTRGVTRVRDPVLKAAWFGEWHRYSMQMLTEQVLALLFNISLFDADAH